MQGTVGDDHIHEEGPPRHQEIEQDDIGRGFQGGGDDLICGRGGTDLLKGGSGDDELRGGRGHDRFVGGPGRDRFVSGKVLRR